MADSEGTADQSGLAPVPPPPPPEQKGWATPPQAVSADATSSTNGWAVAALVTGIAGMVLFSAIFGVVALRQIGRRGQGGRGLAIGGLVASGVWVVVFGVGLAVVLATSADRDQSGQIARGGEVGVQEVRLGDCLTDVQEASRVFSVPATPCTEPHEGQVYALFELPDEPWPGEEEVIAKVEEGCLEELATGFPEAYDDESIEVFYFHPTPAGWRSGDRESVCVALYLDGPRTGSMLD